MTGPEGCPGRGVSMDATGGRARRLVWTGGVVGLALLVWTLPASAGLVSGPGTVPLGRPHMASTPAGLRVAAGPYSGHIGISADGVGMYLSSTGFVSVKIHDPNSTILVALLYSKTNSYNTISQIGFNGQVVPLTFVPGDEPLCCPDFFPTYRADVTDIVAQAIGSGSGVYDFMVDESMAGVDNSAIDGEALYVVYQDDALPNREVYLYEGGVTSATPEDVSVPLLTPYAGGPAKMSIGDSYSTEECPPGSGQYTVITLEGQTVSNCAGGWDDGDSLNNGALITVGGLGDDFYNPAAGGKDDEKYNIAQFIPNGETILDLTFANPSDDDSVFVLAVGITMPTSLPGRLADAGLFS